MSKLKALTSVHVAALVTAHGKTIENCNLHGSAL